MKNEKFIELLIILEEREWDYYIENGLFYIMLGNMEFEFMKTDRQKTIELLDIVKNW